MWENVIEASSRGEERGHKAQVFWLERDEHYSRGDSSFFTTFVNLYSPRVVALRHSKLASSTKGEKTSTVGKIVENDRKKAVVDKRPKLHISPPACHYESMVGETNVLLVGEIDPWCRIMISVGEIDILSDFATAWAPPRFSCNNLHGLHNNAPTFEFQICCYWAAAYSTVSPLHLVSMTENPSGKLFQLRPLPRK